MNVRNLHLAILILVACLIIQQVQSQCLNDCYNHGHCFNDTCSCDAGYSGNECQDCTGRFILNQTDGILSTGPNAVHFSDCTAIIQPDMSPNSVLHVRFDDIKSSCACEFLKAFDGDSVHSPLLAIFNGEVLPSITPEVISSTGSVTLQFESDGQPFYDQGYFISYWLETENGYTEMSSSGDDSDDEPCQDGWCSYSWPAAIQQGRASAGVTMADDVIYVFGGSMFGPKENENIFMALRNVTQEWEVLDVSENSPIPDWRHDHTLVTYKNCLIMYGGALENNDILNEIWMYNLTSQIWSLVNVTNTYETEVPRLIGHTAHVTKSIDDRDVMLVFFGFHPLWGISNLVFELDLETLIWSLVDTGSYQITGSYGHASALDADSNKVYVHGGYNQNLMSSLYMFNVTGSNWVILPPSPEPRHLHSMVMLQGFLYIFGGIGQFSNQRRCVDCLNLPNLKYQTDCLKWIKITTPSTASARFGHAALQVGNSTMLIYGGYDGTMLNDVITYTTDSSATYCQQLQETECHSGCVWLGSLCANHSCSNIWDMSCESLCASIGDLEACASTECRCCFDKQCFYQNSTEQCNTTRHDVKRSVDDVGHCEILTTYQACILTECSWNFEQNKCENYNSTDNGVSTVSPLPCTSRSNCTDCAQLQDCTWCDTTSTCFPSGTAPIYYPYGSCLHYSVTEQQCQADPCSKYQTCDICFMDDRCGWCDLGSTTGFGSCLIGSVSGSFSNKTTCPTDQWHFLDCPDCQCNGHSACESSEPDVCTKCDNGVVGEFCDNCDQLWYGNPSNGQNCTECECNGHARQCANDGFCQCYVKGITGENCEMCLSASDFYGDAVNDTCFYNLDGVSRYNFTITRQYNYDSSQINFAVCPNHSSDVTVQIVFFSVGKQNASIVITTNHTTGGNEVLVESLENVTDSIFLKLSNSNFSFGRPDRRCIRIFTKDIVPPLKVQVAVLQYWDRWWQIVFIFLICFFGMLLIAFVVWRINRTIVHRQRIRETRIEMERMAIRPMNVIYFDVADRLEPNANPKIVADNCVVTAELCNSNEAAVYTTLLWLPTGDGDYKSPSVAFGSSLGLKIKFVMDEQGDDKASVDGGNVSVLTKLTVCVPPQSRPNLLRGIDNHGYELG